MEIGLYFFCVVLGGFFFGLVVGRVIVFWLQYVFNDVLVEIIIILVSIYLIFYIGEEVFGVFGVIVVVMLGIQINVLRISISLEVEVFLYRYIFILFFEECLQINVNFEIILYIRLCKRCVEKVGFK